MIQQFPKSGTTNLQTLQETTAQLLHFHPSMISVLTRQVQLYLKPIYKYQATHLVLLLELIYQLM